MLAKCANRSCSASFRRLAEGRLFGLETDLAFGSSKACRVEYFWLCHRCSSAMTLRVRQDGTVGTVPLPEAIRGVPEGVALAPAHRRERPLLFRVSPPLPQPLGVRAPARLKDAYRAA
jgi:hypothetical protein